MPNRDQLALICEILSNAGRPMRPSLRAAFAELEQAVERLDIAEILEVAERLRTALAADVCLDLLENPP
ncbi:MAG: hypothetical protein PHR35_21735, partial [Kiritimatiellae bacterium]|nr:hypothetical protein [Kiritimatiellia bacterium]